MDVIILGIDIHGIELAGRLATVGGYNLLGFIAAGEERQDTFGGYPILGGPEALAKYPKAMHFPLHTWKREGEFGKEQWTSFIDPLSIVAPGAKIGKGCIIFQHCFIGADAKLEDGVFALGGTIINHHCIIGERVVLTSNVSLAGSVQIGARSYIGQASTVREFITIGSDCKIGMGAVVVKNVPDGTTVIGNPARVYNKELRAT